MTRNSPASSAGWLYKRGRMNPGWKRRFFQLTEGHLHYYTDSHAECLKGVVDVRSCKVELQGPAHWRTSLFSSMTPVRSDLRGEGGEDGFLFTVVTPDRRLQLMATDKSQAVQWAQRLAVPLWILQERSDVDIMLPDSPPGSADSSAGPSRNASFAAIAPCPDTAVSQADLTSAEGCSKFLFSFEGSTAPMLKARRRCAWFNQEYTLGDESIHLRVRLEAWKSTMSFVSKSVVFDLVSTSRDLASFPEQPQAMQVLASAVQTYIMARVQPKMMDGLKAMYAAKDDQLHRILHSETPVQPKHLGIRSIHERGVSAAAIETIQQLSTLETPVEKVYCLRETIHLMVDEFGDATVDDLLSLVVVLMLKAKPQDMFAQTALMTHFLEIPLEAKGELDFNLTMFIAACQFLLKFQLEMDRLECPKRALLSWNASKAQNSEALPDKVVRLLDRFFTTAADYHTQSECA
eukprot:CAMPEP_0114259346 /NCGR_PEP_ID=MMETSP0058-20121206/19842_1 /TAXON_ID=36894 /ORGANISM="Pyramimonas parkeae, CCMP726" /LENGTH=461 /DNA_ID=CAMNT_0001374383 /DNA_START=41 /DNA_END=1426 /DNA_ORIENTATION=+